MRFVVTSEWSRNLLLQTIVACYAVYVVLLWCTNALLYFSKMSLTPSSVVEHYLGNEALFTSPGAAAADDDEEGGGGAATLKLTFTFCVVVRECLDDDRNIRVNDLRVALHRLRRR